MLLLFLAWLVLNLLTADRYPTASCDEGFLSEIGYNAWREGRFGFDSNLGVAGSNISVVPLGRLFEASLGLSQGIFGPSLWSSRLPSLAAGVITAVVLYQLGRSMYSTAIGVVAASLYLLSWQTLYHTHFARPEAMLAMMAIVLLWLLWKLKLSSSPVTAFSLGLIASLAVDVHLNGLVFAIATSFVFLIGLVTLSHPIKWRLVLAFSAGGVIGLVYWLLVHLLPDPQIFNIQMFQFYAVRGATDLLDQNVLKAATSLVSFLWDNFIAGNNYLNAYAAVFYIAGLFYLATDKSQASRLVLCYLGIAFLLFALMVRLKSWYYAMLWIPLFSLATAFAFDKLGTWLSSLRKWPLKGQFLRILLPLLLVLPFLAGDLYLLYKFRNEDLFSYAQPLVERIPPGERLVAPHQFWYARPNEPFVSTAASNWLSIEEQTPIDRSLISSFFERVTPAYVVMTPYWLCLISSGADTYYLAYAYVTESCEPIALTSADYYPAAVLYYCAGIEH